MSKVLARWNRLPADEAELEVLACCASSAWARQLAAARPFADVDSLIKYSDQVWSRLSPKDWDEAFSKHPRVGERKPPATASAQSVSWSAQEQSGIAGSAGSVHEELDEANRQYEQRFGRVFIVCATGKSAQEMLDILRHRLQNDDATELLAAAEEQRKITHLRLQKWLSQ